MTDKRLSDDEWNLLRDANVEEMVFRGDHLCLRVPPSVPDGWEIRPEDQIPSAVPRGTVVPLERLGRFYLPQQNVYSAGAFRKHLAHLRIAVLGAEFLDYFFDNPERVPNRWLMKYLVFFGTTYRCIERPHVLAVRYMGAWGSKTEDYLMELDGPTMQSYEAAVLDVV